MKEVVEIAWKRSDGLVRTSTTVLVSGMVQASDITAYLYKVLNELMKSPEDSAMDIAENSGPDETIGHA